MIPKLLACPEAVKACRTSAYIAERADHAILVERSPTRGYWEWGAGFGGHVMTARRNASD